MKAYKNYSIDRGNEIDEYYMVSGEYGLQVQESGGFYNAVIKGAYKYLELGKDTLDITLN
ncbi:hypothetical protein [Clostridium thermobutyricum]|uniref:hypothetical protein n=1 Tax=Clostridium thermobutyricum TaxID=29372 RepID=UPI0018ABB14F|nr:hypothetical protein [Clostridium thermobutyricum]